MSGLLCLQSAVSLKPSTTRDSNSLSAPHLCVSLEARVRNRCPVQAGVFSSHARNLYLIFKNKQTKLFVSILKVMLKHESPLVFPNCFKWRSALKDTGGVLRETLLHTGADL